MQKNGFCGHKIINKFKFVAHLCCHLNTGQAAGTCVLCPWWFTFKVYIIEAVEGNEGVCVCVCVCYPLIQFMRRRLGIRQQVCDGGDQNLRETKSDKIVVYVKTFTTTSVKKVEI